MIAPDPDVRAVRDAIVPAIERDIARGRRFRSRLALPVAVLATVAAGTGVAAATGVIFAEPKPSGVPPVPEWMYFSHDPSSPERSGGPVLMRYRPEAVQRTNRATERALLERGVTARCGRDTAHQLACHRPNGDLVDPAMQAEALASLDGPDVLEWPGNAEIRPLTEEEARQWLCEHPRPSHPEDAQSC